MVTAAVTSCSQVTPEEAPDWPKATKVQGFFLGEVVFYTGCFNGDRLYWRSENSQGTEVLEIVNDDATCNA